MSLKTKPTTNWPRNPDKPSPFDPLDSELPCLTLNSPITDYVKWLKYAQEELVHSNHNSDVQLILQPLSFRNQLDKTNTLSPYTDGNGNDKMWYPDMAICQTIGQTMTTSLAGKRHRIGLLISPPPWVGKTPKVGVEEDGTEFITYPPGHVSLFFIVAAPPGKFGKTLAIWDSDAEGEIRHKAEERQIQKPLRVREGFTGIQYHLYDFLSKKANLAGTYIGGSGNEGKADCGALAIDTLLSWVRGEQGELTAACLEQMGFRRLAK
jgi:hypothetical protein